MEDDLFDIMGISLSGTGAAWCNLNNMPCITLSSCSRYMENGRCIYAASSDTGDYENEHYLNPQNAEGKTP